MTTVPHVQTYEQCCPLMTAIAHVTALWWPLRGAVVTVADHASGPSGTPDFSLARCVGRYHLNTKELARLVQYIQ